VSDIAHKHFDFRMVEENICRSRTAIIHPLTCRHRRGTGRSIDFDCSVWIEIANDDEWICKENHSVNWLSVFESSSVPLPRPAHIIIIIIILYNLSVSVMPIHYSAFFYCMMG
jgi:hypothetical protein